MALASFSGRMCEDRSALSSHNAFQRSFVVLPKRRGGCKVFYRQRVVQCNALAVSDLLDLPLVRSLARLLSLRQVEQTNAEFGKQQIVVEPSRLQVWTSKAKETSVSAVQLGLSLTGVAWHLAKRVVADLQYSLQELRARKFAEQEKAVAHQKIMDVQTKLQYEIQRKRLEVQGQDQAFVSMLHVLDRCHLDHDVKWAMVQKHTADKVEFSERLQQLYNLAEASKDAVDTLLRPDASRKEINTFWKSPETVAIIAEEDKLKSLVFAQMLQASSSK